MLAGFNAYEDILGYALWPQDYAARFWARGYGDIITAQVTPTQVTPTTVTASNADNRKDRRTPRSDASDGSAAMAGESCGYAREQAAPDHFSPTPQIHA